MKHECSLEDRMEREQIERFCCLYALGELSPEEHSRLEAHLHNCAGCKARIDEIERIILYDLPAVAIARMVETVPEQAAHANSDEILAAIREKAHAIAMKSREDEWGTASFSSESAESLHFWPLSQLPGLSHAAGWAVAVILFAGYFAMYWKSNNTSKETTNSVVPAESSAAGPIKVRELDPKVTELSSALTRAEQHVREARAADIQLDLQLQDLSAQNDILRSQLNLERAKASETGAQLELSLKSLNEQIEGKEALQAQLTDLNERMEKRNIEIAALTRAASVVPVNFPIAEQTVGGGEAKEILGARDLHIVDVYDVDGSGKSSRAYGRIYYVNHDQLIFYAFDLGKLERDHKIVAFQAWGYRQPQSTEVQSLGLFYLDSARLNRWTLRVSDPQILSRIDTLFVTAEPPGGSRFPKGKRLLMASLAGPPNHP